ncbi:Mercuric resistance operon regulatory protein [Clavibacter michiganensis]|jgi:MerR family copper efflux transcriptional regulator|uniref:Mercuric resistance operon regulatory protein n=1 Tax=Clavibacter michiganensis TaxID=28447 RepID=A0A251Y9G0_9MICO|nr:MerR family transcriptional regulator [Clavibacter michiganensis]OUE20900.1 Mercuric resistance operon regulatory protein [Clavibacter michiganensis]
MTASESAITMHIGELAERTGLSHRTIRHYDETGLLPASGRTEGGFRLYTQADLDTLLLIRRMKPLGFSLEEMQELLRVVEGLAEADAPAAARADLRDALAAFIAEAERRRAKLVDQLAQADEFLGMLRRR